MKTQSEKPNQDQKAELLKAFTDILNKGTQDHIELMNFINGIIVFYEFFNGQQFERHGISHKLRSIRNLITSKEDLSFFNRMEDFFSDYCLLAAQNSDAFPVFERIEDELNNTY